MAYLHTTPVSLVATLDSGDNDATEREARQQAIRKFLARAEISKVSLTLSLPGGSATRRVFHDDPRIMACTACRVHGFFLYLHKVSQLPPWVSHSPMVRKQFR